MRRRRSSVPVKAKCLLLKHLEVAHQSSAPRPRRSIMPANAPVIALIAYRDRRDRAAASPLQGPALCRTSPVQGSGEGEVAPHGGGTGVVLPSVLGAKDIPECNLKIGLLRGFVDSIPRDPGPGYVVPWPVFAPMIPVQDDPPVPKPSAPTRRGLEGPY